MNRSSSPIAVTLLLITTWLFPSIAFTTPIHLEYLDRFKLNQPSIGLSEPSGLSIDSKSGQLWVISDDTSAVFKISPNQTIQSLPIQDTEMEAIELNESAGIFYTLNEEKGRLSVFDLTTRHTIKHAPISNMDGFEQIASIIQQAGKNKGFEGLAWHAKRNRLFALLEGPPGLLIEISPDLTTIESSIQLTQALGFKTNKGTNSTIDFSGLAYDAKRDKLWILSDEASSLFLFDLTTQKVTQTLTLQRTTKKGKLKKIKKPEGIAIDQNNNRLYVVCDKKATLYQWKIRD